MPKARRRATELLPYHRWSKISVLWNLGCFRQSLRRRDWRRVFQSSQRGAIHIYRLALNICEGGELSIRSVDSYSGLIVCGKRAESAIYFMYWNPIFPIVIRISPCIFYHHCDIICINSIILGCGECVYIFLGLNWGFRSKGKNPRSRRPAGVRSQKCA